MTDAPAPPPAFRLAGLTHTYPGAPKPALAGVTADLPAGGVVAVLGPSGSGKSTLLSLLGLLWDGPGPSGVLAFHDGRREHDLLRLTPDAGAALRAAAFGFVLQSSYLLPNFSCQLNAGMPLAFHGWPKTARDRWVAAVLAADGVDPDGTLREIGDRLPRQVSLGQRQRFAALRAVVTNPTVVFADEPSSNLNPGAARAVFHLLRGWQAGTLFAAPRAVLAAAPAAPLAVARWLATERPPRTLVLVCHDVQTAREHGARFLLLKKGRLLAQFDRTEWNAHAGLVERVLGLVPRAAGRDEPA